MQHRSGDGVYAGTYSVVARCARTGELGAAVATAVVAVGALVPWVRPGAGAACTQAWTNPCLALGALDRLAAGATAPEALEGALGTDPSADLRQLGVIGGEGAGVAWTGEGCAAWAGHRTGADHAVQGNMLTGPEVVDAMAAAMTGSEALSLDERLMRALEAAQAAGGDRRGRQSAALKVMGREAYARVDLRVDEHPDPVAELRRILGIARLQLALFVEGMARHDGPASPPPDTVVAMLGESPPDRPGGGGSREP